jgi:hypothetical protein
MSGVEGNGIDEPFRCGEVRRRARAGGEARIAMDVGKAIRQNGDSLAIDDAEQRRWRSLRDAWIRQLADTRCHVQSHWKRLRGQRQRPCTWPRPRCHARRDLRTRSLSLWQGGQRRREVRRRSEVAMMEYKMVSRPGTVEQRHGVGVTPATANGRPLS